MVINEKSFFFAHQDFVPNFLGAFFVVAQKQNKLATIRLKIELIFINDLCVKKFLKRL